MWKATHDDHEGLLFGEKTFCFGGRGAAMVGNKKMGLKRMFRGMRYK